MSAPSLQACATSVRQQVKSATICSENTLHQLQALLRPANRNDTQTTTRIQKNTVSSSTSRVRAKSTARSRTKEPVEVLETKENGGSQLEQREKSVLATETFNAALKALTEAVRSNSLAHRQHGDEIVKSSTKGCTSPPTDPPKEPLQDRNPNQQPSPRKSSSQGKRARSNTGVKIIGECAHEALAYMRSNSPAAKGNSTQLQIENGTSALIAKLIALDLEELAWKEIRILKRRIDTILGDDGEPDTANRSRGRNQPKPSLITRKLQKSTMKELFTFKVEGASSAVLGLIITLQSHLVRLIALNPGQHSLEELVESFQSNPSSSPPTLVLRSTKEPGSTPSKAAQQLHTLSQALMSICPRISSSDDSILASSQTGPSPETCFKLQCIALHMRTMWWNISGHHADLQKELWDPFSKCLVAFNRRCSNSKLEKYKTAKHFFCIMREAAIKFEAATEADYCFSSLITTYNTMEQLARDAKKTQEALHFVTQISASYKSSGMSPAKQCTIKCKLATLRLQLFLDGDTECIAENELAEVIEALGSSMKGTSSELDGVLAEATILKRTVLRVMSTKLRSHSDLIDSQLLSALQDHCNDYIFSFLRFMQRYLTSPVLQDTSSKENSRVAERLQIAEHVAQSAVESALAVGKSLLTRRQPPLQDLLGMLHECKLIAKRLDKTPDAESDPETNTEKHLFVQISNFYWSIYLHQKQTGDDEIDMKMILESSAQILVERPIEEKNTGFLAVKWERLSALYQSEGRPKEAVRSLESSIRTHVEVEVLRKAAIFADTLPLQEVWRKTGEVSILGRVLMTWTQLSSRGNRKETKLPIFYDNETLSDPERGLLLEWQLLLLCKSAPSITFSSSRIEEISAKIDQLLIAYNPDLYPIRRLRAMLLLLQLSSVQRDILPKVPLDEMVKRLSYSHSEGSQDMGLAQYEDHIRSMYSVKNILQKGIVLTESLNEALNTWLKLASQSKSWGDITSHIDDIDGWLSTLRALLEFLDMRGMERMRLRGLDLLVRIFELKEDATEDQRLSSAVDLALQSSRLGYSSKAGNELARTEKYLSNSNISAHLSIRWQLAYGEYLEEVGSLDRSREALQAARAIACDEDFRSSMSKSRHERELISQAAYVCSLLAFSQGDAINALAFCRQCVKLDSQVWAVLQTLQNSADSAPKTDEHFEDSGIGSLTTHMTSLSLQSTECAPSQVPLEVMNKGARFWSLVAPAHRSLLLLSALYSHHGLFPEALYYAEQSSKLAKAVQATPLRVRSLTALSELWARAGNLEKAHGSLGEAEKLSGELESGIDLVRLHCCRAKLYGLQKNWRKEEETYQFAEKMLLSIGTIPVATEPSSKDPAVDDSLTQKMGALSVKGKPRTTRKRARTDASKSTTKPRVRRVRLAAQPQTKLTSATSSNTFTLFHILRTQIIRMQAAALNTRNEPEAAVDLLKSIEDVPVMSHIRAQHHIGNAEALLLSALKLLAKDAVHQMLCESAISFPSGVSTGKVRAKAVVARSPRKAIRSPRKAATARVASKAKKPTSPLLQNYVEILQQAWAEGSASINAAIDSSPTTSIYHASNTIIDILILLSAFGGPEAIAVSHPFQATAFTELARTVASFRHLSAIGIDKELSSYNQRIEWPLETNAACQDLTGSELLDAVRFQQDYIDILPESFRVLSLSLNQSRNSLVISCLHAGEGPFIIRIPFTRHNVQDDIEEEDFDFDTGKAELLELIRLANVSTHNARDMTRKGAKSEWWRNRQALDKQLGDILQKIESVWLGGFRGFFNNHPRNATLLSRFSTTFDGILDRYLPSRQKRGKKRGATKQSLDPRVLELFVGLGEPTEDNDLDDDLMDLLYYILDILQFQGERNAYDEIDFDSVVMETLDALSSYHQALASESSSDSPFHTVLVLDKALHCFPWESIPCLKEQSVSRVPSLGSLRDILNHQQREAENKGLDPFVLEPRNGAYVLNPGGDLKNTQLTFQDPLRSLDGWSGIIEHNPSESEMKDMLSNSDLFLFFGHGSGAQYIRSKMIQRLDRCAVALLMGCSSGALTEAGEFEPYGTPITYACAKSPAVVATLWDVTDKDIDRFGMGVLERWGIFAKPEEQKRNHAKKRKGKGRKGEEVESVKRTSLTEAVMVSRDDCVLKYLNGAAPVVYGVPMYLF
ncbi:MAG: hypothetical protein M1834_008055 [Cirrosporium novae-zelandiae]|nr:MAG: hypothetical protein M1834_008055 [Cirrosporium novae-zelandiae]